MLNTETWVIVFKGLLPIVDGLKVLESAHHITVSSDGILSYSGELFRSLDIESVSETQNQHHVYGLDLRSRVVFLL